MSSNLEKCPKCGFTPILTNEYMFSNPYKVRCMNSNHEILATENHKHIADAIDDWNQFIVKKYTSNPGAKNGNEDPV